MKITQPGSKTKPNENPFLSLVRNGYRTIPIRPQSKIPGWFNGSEYTGYNGWQNVEATLDDADRWSEWPNVGWGIITTHTPAIDIDVLDEGLANAIEEVVVEHLGVAPRRFGNAPKRLLVYRTQEPFGKRFLSFSDGNGVQHKIEVLCNGQQFVGGGIHPDTGKPYEWDGNSPIDCSSSDIPLISASQVDELLDEIRETLLETGKFVVGRSVRTSAISKRRDIRHHLSNAQLVEDILEVLPNDYPYDVWITVCAAIKAGLGGDEAHFPTFDTWCLKYKGNTPDVIRGKWESITDSAVGLPYLVKIAGERVPEHASEFRDRLTALECEDDVEFGRMLAEQGSPLFDFDKFFKNQNQNLEPPYQVPDTLEADVFNPVPDNPPGLVGHIAAYHDATSIRVTPIFGLAAGLSAVSALAGGRYEVQMPNGRPVSTALFILALGGTGSGKEGVRSVVSDVLKMASSAGEKLPRRFSAASAPAMLRYLHGRSDAIWMPDEFGRYLKSITMPSGSHQYQLISLVMSLYGLFHGSTDPYTYADGKNNIGSVNNPYLNVLATATPASVKETLGTGAILDGFLNRFIVVLNEDVSPPYRDDYSDMNAATRAEILSRSEDAQLGELLKGNRLIPIVVEDDAEALLISFRDEAEQHRAAAQQRGDRAEPMWSRVYENALRIAGVVAYGDSDPGAPLLNATHAEWAIAFMRWATQQALRLTQGLADTRVGRVSNEIVEFVEDCIAAPKNEDNRDGWVPKNQITRRFQGMKRDRAEALDDLVEGGFLIFKRQGNKTLYRVGTR